VKHPQTVYSADEEIFRDEDPQQLAQEHMESYGYADCIVYEGQTFEANEEELAMMSDALGFEAEYGVHKVKEHSHWIMDGDEAVEVEK